VIINELIRMCNKYYDDGYLALYWNFKKSKPVDTNSGDTLALFIVREINDTFQPRLSDKKQLIEAKRCMRSACVQLANMIIGIDNEYDRLPRRKKCHSKQVPLA